MVTHEEIDAFRGALPQSELWSEVWTSHRRPSVILCRFQVHAKDGDAAFQIILRDLQIAGAGSGLEARPVEVVWYPDSRHLGGTRRWTAPKA